MPVQIYEIAKRLGVESKVVLAKAKELGIAAKVPSSTVDKISAEFLEQQLASTLPPPQPPAIPVLHSNAAPVQEIPQVAKVAGITIQTTSIEVHGLLKRILTGEIPFVIEVSQDDGTPPLRAKLVAELPAMTGGVRHKSEPTPHAAVDANTKRIFIGAYYYASSASKDGWVNLAEFGSTLKKQDATFKPQDFGEKSLGTLVRRMSDVFDMKAEGNTPPVYYIRLKAQTPNLQPQSIGSPPQDSTQPRRHVTGKVHNLKLGFGFIAPDDGSDNAFFHASEVVGCTIFDLRPGDPVEYDAGVNEQGPCAWKVTRLGASGANRVGL
jgi:cold shock CspA family protein